MAATALQNILVEYDYPQKGSSATTRRVDSAYGVTWTLNTPQFVTLSDNTIQSGTDIEGFVYVPDTASTDSCANVTAPYIPSNITRLSNIPPPSEFNVIAFGPWTQKACVFNYLNDANKNGAKAFYTFAPGTGQKFSSSMAPNASDSTWDLGDGGQWKSTYRFPVYALSTKDGMAMMALLSNYSGSIENVPNGVALSNNYPKGATVRIYSQADVQTSATLPSLWVFLLIVLGILLGVLAVASIVMRVVQKRRRRELQRMIANGDVNLEALGFGRIKVSEDVLGKMPLYFYVEHGGTPGEAHAPQPDAASADATSAAGNRSKAKGLFSLKKKSSNEAGTNQVPDKLEEKPVLFPQESCPICLDDYENHVTPVKWLPCSHVFHPACIDPLMREYSSLCPNCKASVLPKDYVPEVTNVMVRRERLHRRFREIERRERERATANPGLPVHFSGIGRFVRVSNSHNNPPNAPNNPPSTLAVPMPNQDVEMQPVPSTETPGQGSTDNSGRQAERSTSGTSAPAGARRPANVSREEWARQRAAALVGTSETVEEAEQREEARKPLWRRILGPVFPTLR